jgi:hypothetical protein
MHVISQVQQDLQSMAQGVWFQKCKCKQNVKGDVSVDLVLQSPGVLSGREVRLVNLKSVGSGKEWDVALHVRGLILHKNLEISGTQIQEIRQKWGVEQLFDMRDPARKATERARKKTFQAEEQLRFNKVAINAGCSLPAKAKLTFSQQYLSEVVAFGAELEMPKELAKVQSWKFVVDFSKDDQLLDQFLTFVGRIPPEQRIKASKSLFLEQQLARIGGSVQERLGLAKKKTKVVS